MREREHRKHRRAGTQRLGCPVACCGPRLSGAVLMSGTAAGVVFLVLLVVALAVVHVPLGDYMYRVYSSQKDSRTERFIYRLIGANPDAEQTWVTYARSLL